MSRSRLAAIKQIEAIAIGNIGMVKLKEKETKVVMRQRQLVYKLNETPQLLAILSVVLTLGMAWIWFSAEPSSATTGDLIPSPREGFLAPDFTLLTTTGESVTLSGLQGTVVIVNLWASWCSPCRAEMPALQRVYEDYQDRGVEVLAINTTFQDSEVDAKAFMEEMNLSFPVLLDRTGSVSRQFQLRALPTTFFIDQEGVIGKVILGGPISETTFQTAVEELFREVP